MKENITDNVYTIQNADFETASNKTVEILENLSDWEALEERQKREKFGRSSVITNYKLKDRPLNSIKEEIELEVVNRFYDTPIPGTL